MTQIHRNKTFIKAFLDLLVTCRKEWGHLRVEAQYYKQNDEDFG